MNNRNWWPSRIQCCIDHIKTAMDVDPWAKELAEELLTVCLQGKIQAVRCKACWKDGEGMDREKVIKGLEQFKADFKPFCGNGSDWARVDDAINLLKEQEAKTGKWTLDDEDANSWECSECGGLLQINDGTPHENDWYFCPYCGSKLEEQAVKWDA